MFPSFLLSKLFRPVYPTSNPATTFLHNGGLFLRRISSNTSSASAEPSSLVDPFAAEVSPASSKPTLTKKELNRDYTVAYLVESCGLSPKDALSASEKIHFATPERPNSVLDLLRNHGFTSTQITNAVRTCPLLLGMDVEKTILPKFEFFQSIGVSKLALADAISCRPFILKRSLKNKIEPICNIIKSFSQSDKQFCSAIKHSSWLFCVDHHKNLLPNIAILQEIGVSNPSISLLLTHWHHALMHGPEEFSAAVSVVKEMGFDPSKSTFVLALNVILENGRKQIWDHCYKIYSTKWGWSEEDILSAFKKHPLCMIMSEKKLNLAMEYLVNTMGWSSKCIVQQPIILGYSLEKRIIPRCCVLRVLWTKGLVRKDLSPVTVLQPVEKQFLERYVTKYEKQVPRLQSVYKGKMDALDL